MSVSIAKLPVAEAVAAASVPGQQERELAFPELGMVHRLVRLEVRRRTSRTLTVAIAAAAVTVVSLGGLWASKAFSPSVHSHEMLALGQEVVTAQLSVTPEEHGSRIVWSCQ